MVKGPLKPADATTYIRGKCGPDLTLHWTAHVRERLEERGLLIGDVIHVLKNGFVHEAPEAATQPNVWKYRIECITPNSGSRTVRLVVIPFDGQEVKIVTVMWVDER